MKNIYLVTAGTKFGGYNQDMTPEGIKQIMASRDKLIPIIPKIPLIVVGTGVAHKQTCKALGIEINGKDKKLSPFCGTSNSIEDDGKVAMSNTHAVPAGAYLGLINTIGFNPWEFISGLPENTLLCSGKELMTALGLRDVFTDGQLYELDVEAQTGKIFKAT